VTIGAMNTVPYSPDTAAAMNRLSPFLVAVLAVSLSASGLAFAQGNSDRNDHGRNEQQQRGDRQARHESEPRASDKRQENDRGKHGERHADRGAGPNHSFHKGERLSSQYRQSRYVVSDWRGRNLRAPPRGYHWVQTGGDYVLVAIATGVILELILNN
jgi:Ni/Co efflux regulator RcnB